MITDYIKKNYVLPRKYYLCSVNLGSISVISILSFLGIYNLTLIDFSKINFDILALILISLGLTFGCKHVTFNLPGPFGSKSMQYPQLSRQFLLISSGLVRHSPRAALTPHSVRSKSRPQSMQAKMHIL